MNVLCHTTFSVLNALHLRFSNSDELRPEKFVAASYFLFQQGLVNCLIVQEEDVILNTIGMHKNFDWNDEKNILLQKKRNISFEEIIIEIESGHLLDRIKHPNWEKYPEQMIFYVQKEDYVYAVPFVEDDNSIFLKTIIPDRRATKKYLGGK